MGKARPIAVGSFALLCACAGEPSAPAAPATREHPATDRPEMVLRDGMHLTVRNRFGTIAIDAGEGLSRTFTWGAHRVSTQLTPRRDRWNGSLGAYDPAAAWIGNSSVVADEGRQFFDTEDEVMFALYAGSAVTLPVWTPDGLVVGFGYPPARGDGRVTVEIWQIYVNGAKPTALPGARPDLIALRGGETASFANPNDAKIGYERIKGKKRLVIDVPYSPLTGLAP